MTQQDLWVAGIALSIPAAMGLAYIAHLVRDALRENKELRRLRRLMREA